MKKAISFTSDVRASESVVVDIARAYDTVVAKSGAGAEYLGWYDLPETYDKEEFARIKAVGANLFEKADILIVVGIGGSYLGARAAIESLTGILANEQSREGRSPKIYFAGNHLSGAYLDDLLAVVAMQENVYVNVISKSGTTLEPAATFRVLREALVEKYGAQEYHTHVIATTDKEHGALKTLSEQEAYETFVVPDDVGGRYSVLTAVGLLPIAAAGIDIDDLMDGARHAKELCSAPAEDNPSMQYAAARTELYRTGKKIEIFAQYDPSLHYLAEWWKQLFGESEGKDGKGLFPTAMDFTTDLHSLGQYVQEGARILCETTLQFGANKSTRTLMQDVDNLDGLNYLAGKTFGELNDAAREGTVSAHRSGGVPQMDITIANRDAYHLGVFFYTCEHACAISAYALGVNPFNQPGVEAYKKNMFALLGKSG